MEEKPSYMDKNDAGQPSVKRFEDMIAQDAQYFFDVDEFEIIVDHYVNECNYRRALRALRFATSQHPCSSELLIRKAQILADESLVF